MWRSPYAARFGGKRSKRDASVKALFTFPVGRIVSLRQAEVGARRDSNGKRNWRLEYQVLINSHSVIESTDQRADKYWLIYPNAVTFPFRFHPISMR